MPEERRTHALAVAVAVAVGGAVGAGLRWLLGWPVLAVNVVGCALLGGVAGRGRRLAPTAAAGLGPGFCGGFTTLSGVAVVAAGRLRGGEGGRAVVELAAQLVLGVAAFAVARRVADR